MKSATRFGLLRETQKHLEPDKHQTRPGIEGTGTDEAFRTEGLCRV